MRREERHHLKENALAAFLVRAQDAMLARRRTLAAGGAAAVLALAGAGGYFVWQQQRASQAGEMLAEALIVLGSPVEAPPEVDVDAETDVETDADAAADGEIDADVDAEGDTDTEADADGDPDTDVDADAETDTDADTDAEADADGDLETDAETDVDDAAPVVDWVQPEGTFPTDKARLEAALERFSALADAYPDLRPGIFARYEAAGVLVELDRFDEAAAAYEQVIAAAGNHLHASVARLGLAEARLLGGDAASAAELLEQETLAEDSTLPRDAVLLRLGQAREAAGQESEALAAFTRVLDEFPLSSYASEARRRVDALEPADDAEPASGN